MKRVNGGVTAPLGFTASGIHAGIKPTKERDLALVLSSTPGPIAGVFTTNRLPAASIILNQKQIKQGLGQALVINSGNANAFTGQEGFLHSQEIGQLVADQLGISSSHVFVNSTGVIGVPLPMSVIRRGIPQLVSELKRTGHKNAAEAILTTDTRTKEFAIQSRIAGKLITIGGMAKGSGMIHPNMATMLAYLTTDVAISPRTLQTMLRRIANETFNCISVDGETSTNDTVLCLTNGMAKNPKITGPSPDHKKFSSMLLKACHHLALEICRDGEGATKVVKIAIMNATNDTAAAQFANALATSPLVKTAIFGEDPNWGRIIASLGGTGLPLQEKRIVITFNNLTVVKEGRGVGPQTDRKAKAIMTKPTYVISISLGMGRGMATRWTTDLSYDYIKINASYRS